MATFDEPLARDLIDHLVRANAEHESKYSGDAVDRQPVHVVYGGANRFKAETSATFGRLALQLLETYAPSPDDLAHATGVPESVADTVYARVLSKLRTEPVEDFRIDFEDGYGHRTDVEEDQHAVQSAREMVRGLDAGSLPPFIGLRIKPLTTPLHHRAIRTLDLFLTEALQRAGRLPDRFAVTLPKVTIPEQVSTLAELLSQFESKHGLAHRSIAVEIMIETPPAIVNEEGRFMIPRLIHAAGGRCRGAHFGPYDFSSACNITSEHQSLTHPTCNFARHMIQVAVSGTGVTMADGPTSILPIPPHRGTAPSDEQIAENRAVIHRAMRLHYNNVHQALTNGIYEGWDLHPAQLPTRYAAVYAYFLRNLNAVAARLRNFTEKAAQATMIGDVFDDAATGQGLLNFFLRGHSCGALTDEDVLTTGLTLQELRSRSFLHIVENRRAS